jgi:hypothetical protein
MKRIKMKKLIKVYCLLREKKVVVVKSTNAASSQ